MKLALQKMVFLLAMLVAAIDVFACGGGPDDSSFVSGAFPSAEVIDGGVTIDGDNVFVFGEVEWPTAGCCGSCALACCAIVGVADSANDNQSPAQAINIPVVVGLLESHRGVLLRPPIS